MRQDRVAEQYAVARAHPDAVKCDTTSNKIDRGVPHFSDCWELFLKTASKLDRAVHQMVQHSHTPPTTHPGPFNSN